MTTSDTTPLTRRRWLASAATLAASAGATVLAGAQNTAAPSASKGPKVFLDYDQAELDAAYTQEVWAANADQLRARYVTNSAAARTRLDPPMHVAYGPTEIETLDVYRTTTPNAPIHIFVHGGAWRAQRAANYAFVAEMFVHAGAHFVVPDFAWVQDVGGSLMTMADQVRRSILWVQRHAKTFGGDPERIYVSGHSSGGHLAAVALTTDWHALGAPASFIKGALACSGLFDLKGPRLSARSAYVAFDDETEQALSPVRHLERLSCPVVVAYGSLDSPEFQRQSREFAAALKARGQLAELIYGDGYNHFELIETIGNPYGLIGRAALRQMQLLTV